jgi:hypothetical protein
MAQFTFLIRSGELRLTVLIGHDHNALAALIAAGKALPPPIWADKVRFLSHI